MLNCIRLIEICAIKRIQFHLKIYIYYYYYCLRSAIGFNYNIVSPTRERNNSYT